jgi:hypothetical protein
MLWLNRCARSPRTPARVKILVDEVNPGGQEQARGSAEVARVRARLGRLTQASAAQESASAAKHLNAQSDMLKNKIVTDLINLVGKA